MPVFKDIGSLNQYWDIMVKMTVPIANPIRRDGHICPPKCSIMHWTEYINK